ncbi:protein kinase domain-containing protein [Edaphobacter bradus]|uniref:protein kinase domain-containing protein n=1 Tax=Edaphobacter bradus TaxID=2259016 RepID=UPI0021DFB181|nr:protein kinase [Edaphobacter bradus]
MIGQTISHYRILAKLGEGGMGVVYRARDLTLGREIALKFLPADAAATPRARRRLLKEAQAASHLNHPNIATIYEMDKSEGSPFIAMELVTGATLKQILRYGALEARQFPDVARQIAEGLGEAHRAGVFHGDIKPANIMLDARSHVKILDFGLATLAQRIHTADETEETRSTTSSTQDIVGGTIPYMSPEQLCGAPAGAQGDIFSYGVLLYECLTGRLPFNGETPIDVRHAILRTPPTSLRSLLPEISPELERLIDRCLAKPVEQRCASMEEVLDALRRFADPALQPRKCLAVLYFENLNGTQEDEYFRDGMTEDVITELAKIKDFRLFPRSAVFAFRDKPLPVTQVGQHLGAAYVLEGSIRRSGSRLRITAQLAETRTGHSVWAERYDRQLEDVFAIQDEIAQNIARALRVTLTERERHEIEKIPTSSIQAYDYYLRGRQFYCQMLRKGLEFARQMFARAIVIDPGYARAYAGVGDCCSFLYMWCEASEDNLREAVSASRRAVELDPQSAEARASHGFAESLSGNYEIADKEFETAIELNSHLFEAYYFYGRSCFAQGQYEKAAALFARAGLINPEDYATRSLRGLCYTALGRMEEAAEACRDCLQVLERYVELHPDDARAVSMGARCFYGIGDHARSLEWAERALSMAPEEPLILYTVACSYACLKQADKALDCLEKAFRHGFGHREWIHRDPGLSFVREHPRFLALMQASPPIAPD